MEDIRAKSNIKGKYLQVVSVWEAVLGIFSENLKTSKIKVSGFKGVAQMFALLVIQKKLILSYNFTVVR